MLDLIIRGGQVVTPNGAGLWDVGVADGRIALVAAPDVLQDVQAARTLDARGKLVIPGGIDPHIHCNWPVNPGLDGTAPVFSAGPEQVSRAALHGGTTTLVDFAIVQPGDTLEAALRRRELDWKGACHCDYAWHLMLQGAVPPELLAQLPEAIQAGHSTIKIFTTNIRPAVKGRKIGYGDIWEIFKVAAKHGAMAAIHAEEDDLVMHMYQKLTRENRVGFENMAEVHSTLSEDLSFRHIIRLAENVEGMALYMMHVSAETGIVAIRESRARGFPIYGESLHQYMLYTNEDYKRPNGQIYHTYPSLKPERDRLALWQGTVGGEISTVATDGICTPLCVKVQGRRIDDTSGGNAGVEPRLSVMYSETVAKRGYTLERFVDLVSANAARIMGLYPRKGAIAVGSDADIVIFDPAVRRRVRLEDLHETDYSPWEGYEVAGWPETTILRGRILVDRGQFFGEGKGEWIPRKIEDAIRSAPAL
ncbi:MAG: amidohydrolase family protein [Burkholderiales bacterium]